VFTLMMTWLILSEAEPQAAFDIIRTVAGLGVSGILMLIIFGIHRGWIRPGREVDRLLEAEGARYKEVIAIKDAKAADDLRHFSNLTEQVAEQWGKREADLVARLAKAEQDKEDWRAIAMQATHQSERVTKVTEKMVEGGKLTP
jgi:hypothetical protein